MWLEGAHPLEINEILCKERERERIFLFLPAPIHLAYIHIAYSTPCIQYTENIQTSCEDGAPTRGI